MTRNVSDLKRPHNLSNFKALVAETRIWASLKLILDFWNLRSIRFLSMPHSCITRPCVEIKAGFSSCVIEKDVKVNGLESTVHKLSIDALFVYH